MSSQLTDVMIDIAGHVKILRSAASPIPGDEPNSIEISKLISSFFGLLVDAMSVLQAKNLHTCIDQLNPHIDELNQIRKNVISDLKLDSVGFFGAMMSIAFLIRQSALSGTNETSAEAKFIQQILEADAEREAATAAGIPALIRLADIADRDSGQANTVRRFLLGLYNGYRFPFNLIELRGLDKALFDDCMAVLTLDARATAKEIHHYLDDGGERFERWAQGGAA